MVTIKENRTGRIIKVGRQFANVFIRLGTHTKVEPDATEPIRNVVAEAMVEKQLDGAATEVTPKRKYTRRKKQTDTDS